ncbi:MAG: phytanoyl-CoA dioxygenase family protein [bacterium]|nr:phytanoyl-CoA dioxygenase family protein [bacterium]
MDNAGDYGDPPISLEMRTGQISLHGDRILHGSEPNRSDRRRYGETRL